MTRELKAGDPVRWNASSGEVKGKVVKTLTRPKKIKGFTAKASPGHPEVLVRSDKTGDLAAHEPKALKRDRKGG